MKTYKIFVSPLGQIEAVKQGWSWPGCLFSTVWTLVKKMWGIAAVLWGAYIFGSILMGQALLAEAHGFFFLLMAALNIGVPILVGSQGNKWREKNLLTRGYEDKEMVQAQTPEAALALWVKETSRDISGSAD